MNKIAILGATGHIAKGLIFNFCKDSATELFLYARSTERTAAFLKDIQCDRNGKVHIGEFHNLYENNYTAIINCAGLGTPKKVKESGNEIFKLTEYFDDMVIRYLDRYPETTYINVSSGAVYGKEFKEPVNENSVNRLNVNKIGAEDFYSIAKVNSEAKHRTMSNYTIIDLRVFGYFSRFIDLDAGYLLTEIITCVKNGSELVTEPNNIMRDYVHPEDLYSLIQRALEVRFPINDAFDVVSRKPVSKFEIFDYFKKEYGLRYSIEQCAKIIDPTGSKHNYYSLSKKAEILGYYPKYSSMKCVEDEAKIILINMK